MNLDIHEDICKASTPRSCFYTSPEVYRDSLEKVFARSWHEKQVVGIVEIVRCVEALRRGAWPSREEDVEEVDVDKLKEMVHVKDEDLAALDQVVTRRQGEEVVAHAALAQRQQVGRRRERCLARAGREESVRRRLQQHGGIVGDTEMETGHGDSGRSVAPYCKRHWRRPGAGARAAAAQADATLGV